MEKEYIQVVVTQAPSPPKPEDLPPEVAYGLVIAAHNAYLNKKRREIFGERMKIFESY